MLDMKARIEAPGGIARLREVGDPPPSAIVLTDCIEAQWSDQAPTTIEVSLIRVEDGGGHDRCAVYTVDRRRLNRPDVNAR
jgi:hypothetical protein